MFGKGVYFADMSSKSANYCAATPTQSEALLMLSEVALGDVHELTKANNSLPKGLPKGKLSVKGVGSTAPDPSEFQHLPDGLLVPCGSPMTAFGSKGNLLYNEYIVYDVTQIISRFLLRVRFNWKS